MPSSTNLGFMTVVQDAAGYSGGYLVTNSWGRPLEFRLSTPMQPSRVQQILYGASLKSYLYSDLIGRTLVEKTQTAADLVIVDSESLLDLRLHVSTPVVWLASSVEPDSQQLSEQGALVDDRSDGKLLCHPTHLADNEPIRKLLEQAEGLSDLAEPFSRVREALTEARKMGAGRAA